MFQKVREHKINWYENEVYRIKGGERLRASQYKYRDIWNKLIDIWGESRISLQNIYDIM